MTSWEDCWKGKECTFSVVWTEGAAEQLMILLGVVRVGASRVGLGGGSHECRPAGNFRSAKDGVTFTGGIPGFG